MTTPHTAKLLQGIMALQKWTQNDLAARAALSRASVGQHLSLTRAIRDEHLRAYLHAIPAPDAPRVLAAWLHDLLADDTGSHLLQILFDPSTTRLCEDVVTWSPSLTPRQTADLDWWARHLPAEPELDILLEMFTRRAKGG